MKTYPQEWLICKKTESLKSWQKFRSARNIVHIAFENTSCATIMEKSMVGSYQLAPTILFWNLTSSHLLKGKENTLVFMWKFLMSLFTIILDCKQCQSSSIWYQLKKIAVHAYLLQFRNKKIITNHLHKQ